MRIFPKDLEIGDNDGFSADEVFGYETFGADLGTLFEKVEDPMVAVLNAPWGAGKSVFVKKWCGYMRNRGFPVIYFNAFKNDYAIDAFLVIAGEVATLADKCNVDRGERLGFYKSSLRVAGRVMSSAVKGGAKKIVERAIGDDATNEVYAAFASGGVDGVGKEWDACFERWSKQSAQVKDDFQNFGIALTELSKKISASIGRLGGVDGDGTSEAGTRPLIFVIDELDRCRPTFALELLEKVKHFFSVECVHFLIVTHLEQIENTAMHIYGVGDGAKIYLQRFYNVVINMPHRSRDGKRNIFKYLEYLLGEFCSSSWDARYVDELKIILIKYIKLHKLELRSIERIVTQIAILLSTTTPDSMRVAEMVSGLCVIKIMNQALYFKIRTGSAKFDEVCSYLGIEWVERDDALLTYELKFWLYALAEDEIYERFRNSVEDIEGYFLKNNIVDRGQVLSNLCTKMDSLAFVGR